MLLIIIVGGAASFFAALFILNRMKKKRELRKRQKLHNASRAPLSSMRASRKGARHDRRHVVSRSLQLDQLSDQAREAYENRQRRRVEQFTDLQLVMDEIFIPERDAVETEKKSVDDADEAEGSFMSVDAAEKRNVKKSDLKLDDIADDKSEDEFTCTVCFMVLRNTQLAKPRSKVCIDCV